MHATNKKVTFITDDSSIATITPVQGKVTAVTVGTAIITGTTENGKNVTCEITVNEEEG